MPVELFTIINAVVCVSMLIGIYKNKIDTQTKIFDKYSEIETRIVRLEEKINFVIEKLKTL